MELAWPLSLKCWLVDRVFQRFTRLKLGNLGGLDFDGFAGLGIAPGAGRSVADLKRAESDEGHWLLLFQARGDGVQGAIDRAGGRSF